MENVTKLYDEIWSNFDKQMIDEAIELLKIRWKRNGLSWNLIKDKTVLDMGCGSGRYSIALKVLGAKKVTGIDAGKGVMK